MGCIGEWYHAANGYSGKLYGKSSLSIYDPHGREILHTTVRAINTLRELGELVKKAPEFLKMLEGVIKEGDSE